MIARSLRSIIVGGIFFDMDGPADGADNNVAEPYNNSGGEGGNSPDSADSNNPMPRGDN